MIWKYFNVSKSEAHGLVKGRISTTTFMGRLGHHCTSVYSLLAQTISLPTASILRVKYSPGQLKTIKIHAFWGKPHALLSYH